MANLYVTEQGAVLRKSGDRLIVEKDDQELLEIECFKIDAVFLFGGVQVTTHALTELLEHGISLVLLTQDGALKGRLVPPVSKNVLLREAQYRRHFDADFSLGLARLQVGAKVRSCRSLLSRQVRNHPELDLEDVLSNLSALEKKTATAATLEELLGLEGVAARTFFKGFARACRKELKFPGRRKHPPTDPVNALLSLGYVLLGTELAALLEGTGFDPYLGFYHRLAYGRMSLALDLLEEFRAVIDQLVLRLTNLGVIGPEDFQEAAKTGAAGETTVEKSGELPGVCLKAPALRKFLQAYGEHLSRTFCDEQTKQQATVRSLARRQVERLAAHVLRNEDYVPCYLRL